MWDSKVIASIIKNPQNITGLKPNHIHLQLFDTGNSIGIGTDGQGSTVLVLPGQNEALAFQTEFASYDPWSSPMIFETGMQLDGVSILSCKIDVTDEDTSEAAAAIFYGLLDLQAQFGKTGKAIWQLKSLFENRLKFDIPESKVTGLMGELLVILAANSSGKAVKFWHSNTDDKFDFSGANFRLDVKSTIMNSRNHYFSSHQIPGNAPEKTFIASVQVMKVENGKTLSDLLDLIKLKIPISEFSKVNEIVLATIGIPANLLANYHIDLTASINSIVLIKGTEIPRPIPNVGVISMEWLANLDGLEGISSFIEDFFERL